MHDIKFQPTLYLVMNSFYKKFIHWREIEFGFIQKAHKYQNVNANKHVYETTSTIYPVLSKQHAP